MRVEKGQMVKFLLAPNTAFKMPIYQRAYSWTKEECAALFKDLLLVVDKEREHFIGPVVYMSGSYSAIKGSTCMIIDGQQRITSIYLLILAVYRYLKEQTDERSMELAKCLKPYLFLNGKEVDDFTKGDDLKIQLTDFDNQQLLNLLRDPFNIPNENHLIYQNFKFFYEEILATDYTAETIIEGLDKLIIVDLSLEKDQDDPQVMFESLNATGKGLTSSDLIQNFLLMDLPESFQENIYRQYWYPLSRAIRDSEGDLSDFLTQYLVLKTKKQVGNKNRLYQEFKNYFEDCCKQKDLESFKAFIIDLYRFSEMYLYLKGKEHEVKAVELALSSLRKLNITTTIPLTMQLLNYYENDLISVDDLVYSLHLMESFIVRRFICDKPTNELPHVFLKVLKLVTPEDFREKFESTLMRCKNNQVFPRDIEFKAALIEKKLYQDHKYCSHILQKIINHHSKEILNIKEFTIEHIMPQTTNLRREWIEELGANWEETHEIYVHTIGNLTLTRYNSEMGTRPFLEKKTMPGGFNDSACWLNKTLAEVETWNKESILERANLIGEECCTIWKIPAEVMEESEYSQLLTFDDEWTGRKVSGFNLLNQTHQVRDFADLLVKVTEVLNDSNPTECLCGKYNRTLVGMKKLFLSESTHSNHKPIANTAYFMDTGNSSKAKKEILLKLLELSGLTELDLEIYSK